MGEIIFKGLQRVRVINKKSTFSRRIGYSFCEHMGYAVAFEDFTWSWFAGAEIELLGDEESDNAT